MWKRLRGKENTAISSPTLIETTYDEKSLGKLPGVSDAQSPTSPQDTLGQLPQLPFRSLAPGDRLGPPPAGDSRTSKVASSVYSQPGVDDRLPLPDYGRGRQVASSVYSQPTPETQFAGPDVSPPSTPGGPDDGSVSPIEDNNNDWKTLPKANQQANSRLPVLRKGQGIPTSPPQGRPQGPRQNPTTTTSTRSASSGSVTKWDKYSGEPTTKPGGLTGNFNPTKFESGPNSQSRKLDPERYGFGGNDNQKATVAERASRFASANKRLSIETKSRPQPSQPWDRAIGRSAIVPTVKDNPAVAPLAIPPRSNRRPSPANTPQSNSPASATRRVHPDAETLRVPTVREVPNSRDGQDSGLSDGGTIKPTVPLKAGRNSPPRVVASPTAATQSQGTGYPSPVSPGSGGADKHTRSLNDKLPSAPQGNAISNSYSTQQHRHTQSGKSSSNAKTSSESRRTNDPAALDSRFSWTTYNTDASYQAHSPPPSPPPPMPTMLATARPVPTPAGPSNAAQHLMNRSRPLPRQTSSSSDSRHSNPLRSNPVDLPPASPITRKPAPSIAPSIVSTSTSLSTDKALPPPPHALHTSTQDHIASLQAQRDDLAHRRANVERLVRDLTRAEAATRNPLVTSYRERRMIERKVESLKGELAEIGIMEHAVGLRLHRAWRRREKDNPDALGTALWVRRVTAGEL